VKGTVFLDRARGFHFVIVRETKKSRNAWDDLHEWEGLVLDTDEAGEMCVVWDYELKHGRFAKVG
jgi:hypothetical protein